VRLTEGELREGLRALGDEVDEFAPCLSAEERLGQVLARARACQRASGHQARRWAGPRRRPLRSRLPRPWRLLAHARDRGTVAPVGAVALLVSLVAGLVVARVELRDGRTAELPKALGRSDANVIGPVPGGGDSTTPAGFTLPRSASAASCALYKDGGGIPCGLLGDWVQPASDPAILPPGGHLVIAFRTKLGWQMPSALGGSVLRRDFGEVFGNGTSVAGFTAVAEGAAVVGAGFPRQNGSGAASARWWDVKITTNPLLTGSFQAPVAVAAPALVPRYRQPAYLPVGARLTAKGAALAGHGFVERYALPGPAGNAPTWLALYQSTAYFPYRPLTDAQADLALPRSQTQRRQTGAAQRPDRPVALTASRLCAAAGRDCGNLPEVVVLTWSEGPLSYAVAVDNPSGLAPDRSAGTDWEAELLRVAGSLACPAASARLAPAGEAVFPDGVRQSSPC